MIENSSVAVEIAVSDTGCGMTTEKLESIFREFEEVETPPPASQTPPPQSKGLGELRWRGTELQS